MVEFKKILNFIIYILKIFIYFDIKDLKYQSQSGGGENNSDETSNSNNAAEEIENSGILPYSMFIKETIMGVLSFVGAKIMTLISMLLFASIAPIIPFFVSMGGMFGVVKYFMSKLRRL